MSEPIPMLGDDEKQTLMLQAIDLSFLEDGPDISSDEGYGSTNSSPDSISTEQFTFTQEEKSPVDCCGIASNTWKPTMVIHTNWKDALRAEILRELTMPPSKLQLQRSHVTIPPNRVVVGLDIESVSPAGKRLDEMDLKTHFERKPWGIAVNSRTEQVYIADRQYHVILVFRPDGRFQFQFGGQGDSKGLFNRPTGVAYDVVGNRIFVVDKDNHRVQAFDYMGDFLFHFGSRGTRPGNFWYPWGIAVSKDGKHIVISDARNHRIQLFKPDGTYIRQFSVYRKASEEYKTVFNYPRGVTFDQTGKFIYVTDFNLHCIFRLDINFIRLEKLVGPDQLCRPSGIDVDVTGNIIVCDTRHHAIKVFSPNGHLLATYNRLQNGPFDLPLDVSIMPAVFIAVLDLNGRVRIF